jgi:hypothetical protein
MGKPKQFIDAVAKVLAQVPGVPVINGAARLVDIAIKDTPSGQENPSVEIKPTEITASQAETLLDQETQDPFKAMLEGFGESLLERFLQLPSDDQEREDKMRHTILELAGEGYDEGKALVLEALPFGK